MTGRQQRWFLGRETGDRERRGTGGRWSPSFPLPPVGRLPRSPDPPIRRLLCSLLLLVVASPVLAQSGLRMENALPVASLRSGGPLYVMGELQWDRPDLLEGRLRFTLRDGPEVLAVVETDPIVIVSGGRTRFRQLLPVPEGQLGYGMSAVTVEFLADGVTFSLGEILVTASWRGIWQVVVLGIEPSPGAGLDEAERLQQEIAFERAMSDPKGEVRDGDEFAIRTSRPVLPVVDLPEQPLAYCAFDTVLLPHQALTRATGRQLTAISDWVRAGGAVCVAVGGPLEQKQAKFFDELFRDSDAGPFVRDDEGRLLEPEGTASGVFARPAGLGVAVLLFGRMDQFAFDTPAWREAHARLWRLREPYVAARRAGRAITAEMIQSSRAGGRIIRGEVAAQSFPGQYGNTYYPPAHADPIGWTFPAAPIGTSVIQSLQPDTIRLMPGWAVVLILFGYVAIVGPLDYLVLGTLKLRRWTWLTFPAVTLGVTWGVVATANRFMSDNDHMRSVEIIDLDAKGEPVRRSRLDLHFRGSTEPVVHELEKAYFTRLDPVHFPRDKGQWFVPGGPTGAQPQNTVSNDAPTGPYVGTIASRYVVPQQIAKWTPQVNRIFEIAPSVNVPKIDWKALETQRNSRSYSVKLPGGGTGYVAWFGADGYGLEGGPVAMVSGHASLLETAATATFPLERWSLQFQRSPLGLGRLDDLPFVDVNAEGLDAIVVWTKQPGGGITIYRKPVLTPDP